MSVNKSKGPIIDPGLCRCCGAMKRCRLLNVEYEYLGQKEIYSDLMMDCFGLLLSHLDSKQTERLICATCVSRLREAYSFRKQVLQCEEAFLQMKVYYDDNEVTDQKHPDQQKPTAVQVEIVKMEPDDKISDDENSPSSPLEDALADDNVDCDYQMGLVKIEKKAEEKTDSNSDEIPISQISDRLKRLRRIPVGLPAKQINSQLVSKGDVTRVTSKLGARFRSVAPMTSKPNNLPLSRVQQLIRERDPSYVRETNILTIIEFSFAVPFKCRHNHLLCYYCGQNFINPQLLREHAITHNPKKFKVVELRKMIKIDLTRIDCRLCPEKIDSLEEFKTHISMAHNKKYYNDFPDWILPFKLLQNETKCVLCDESFSYFHALNKHMNVHYRNYVCETCGLGFVDHGRFFMHQQRHENGDFPCEICGKVFKAAYNKDLHVDRVHKKKGRVFCPKCDVKLMSYPQKLKHLVEVHGEQPLTFPCSMCDKVYETRRMLTIHIRKEHLKDYRYECQYCGQKFFTRFALNNHMPTHTGERNFKCKVCEKTYPRLKTLKDHMRIHTNDRRYRCHICGQAFIQNCSLKGHMKSQHPEYG